jgi:1-acyl-sn-glycerol-3-phosphate acyltransferase
LRHPLIRATGRALFRLRGWSFEPLPADWEAKQVVIGFPHSTWADTMMAFAGFAMVGQKGHVIVKREAFRWPFSRMLRGLGAIPVDRGSASGLVGQLAREFASRETFQLALVPEGTRKSGAKVKTGFWYIARAAKVPIVCWYLDARNRRTRWVGRLVPSDDVAADLRRIKQMYAAAGHVIEGIAD